MGCRRLGVCRHYDAPTEPGTDREQAGAGAGMRTRVQRALVQDRDRPNADEPLDGLAVAVGATWERGAQRAEA